MEELKTLIRTAVNQLLLKDRLIFDAPIGQEDTEIERVNHEVCINHRLAVHLENNLDPNLYAGFSVDIEYNRNYEVVKKARRTEDEQEITVRPDILIHKRVGGDIDNDNYLVVEAKKQDIIANDINKIERLILLSLIHI